MDPTDLDEETRESPWIYRAMAGLLAVFVLLAGAFWLVHPEAEPPPAARLSDRPTLLVIETESCSWCRRFRRDVAPKYVNSSYESRAPLRYVHRDEQRQSGYRLKSSVSAVPTFVLVDTQGIEVDRLRGYPGGGAKFFSAVDHMLAKLDAR
jgi:thiol-disulfide isomerase/thioredoxin